jgi:hypothetical protein
MRRAAGGMRRAVMQSEDNFIMAARGQTENGANCSMFVSAIKASRSGRSNRLQLSFSAPFLCFFLWTNKERKEKIKIRKLFRG